MENLNPETPAVEVDAIDRANWVPEVEPEVEVETAVPVAAVEPAVVAEPVIEEAAVDLLADTADEPVIDEPAVGAVLPRHDASKNVVQTQAHSTPCAPHKDGETFVYIPSDTVDRLTQAVARLNVTGGVMSDSVKEFLFAIKEGEELRPVEGMFTPAANREGSQWRQTVQSQRGTLAARRPSFNDGEHVKLTGKSAIRRAQTYLGQGGGIQIALWHTGVWITINTPSDTELLNLERRIADEKILLGRITNGRVFSNSSVFLASAIFELVMKHLDDTSMKNRDNIAATIRTPDLQAVIWGLAATVWPNGFKYARALLGETEAEDTVITENLNLTKLQWTDISQLNEWQLNHMASRHGSSMSNADIEKYRSEFNIGKPRRVQLQPGIAVILAVPSVQEYIASGQRWVNEIVMMEDRLFGMDTDIDARNEHIINQSRATAMRQYSHWVESVVLGDDDFESVITTAEDKATVDTILTNASANDDARLAFFTGVNKFIEDMTISVIATPTVDAKEENKFPAFPHLLPIDSMTTFFTLLGQKTTQIRMRT